MFSLAVTVPVRVEQVGLSQDLLVLDQRIDRAIQNQAMILRQRQRSAAQLGGKTEVMGRDDRGQ